MRYLILVIVGLILLACTRDPEYYRQKTSMDLCVAYLTKPSGNIHQSDRAAELARRGEDCTKYAGIAEARIKADAARQSAKASRRPVYQVVTPTNNMPASNTHTYMINGRMVTCSTMGTMTSCF